MIFDASEILSARKLFNIFPLGVLSVASNSNEKFSEPLLEKKKLHLKVYNNLWLWVT